MESDQSLRVRHRRQRARRAVHEGLEHRQLLTSWIAALPADVSYVAIAQQTNDSELCIAFASERQLGVDTLRADGTEKDDRVVYSSVDDSTWPVSVHDAVFAESGGLQVGGATSTPNSLQGGDGEPTKWVDGTVTPSGLETTTAGNSGALYAANRHGQFVGEDDLLPILHDAGQTSALPLPGEDVIGSAFDLNEDRIVGYSNDDAVVWERTANTFEPWILEHRESDSFGVANTISGYGVIGGSYRRENAGATATVGLIWNRDGRILREFTDAEVTHVVDL